MHHVSLLKFRNRISTNLLANSFAAPCPSPQMHSELYSASRCGGKEFFSSTMCPYHPTMRHTLSGATHTPLPQAMYLDSHQPSEFGFKTGVPNHNGNDIYI